MNFSPLAAKVVALPAWRWMPGMVAIERDDTMRGRVLNVRRNPDRLDVFTVTGSLEARDDAWHVEDATPDLSDSATLGCLLALVREAWGDPSLCVVFDHDDGRWNVGRWEDGLVLRGRGGASEAEALVNALEGAP